LDVKRVYWTAENWEFLKADSMVGQMDVMLADWWVVERVWKLVAW